MTCYENATDEQKWAAYNNYVALNQAVGARSCDYSGWAARVADGREAFLLWEQK